MFYIIKVNQFQGSVNRPAVADKNGFAPVILSAHNGTLPEKARVISGTVAQRAGMQVGHNYAVKVSLVKIDDQYGEQYQYEVIGELSTMEVITGNFKPGVVQNAVTKVSTPATVNAGAQEDDDKDF